jgi:uncharacterized protein
LFNKCFYHSADLDGLCSGAIVKHFIPNCQMLGIDYGEIFPWDNININDEILMVDFALQPFNLMHQLKTKCKYLLWIDHHISAMENHNKKPLPNVFLSENFAACQLTWKNFSKDPIPQSIQLIGSYDIWDHKDPLVLPYQYGLRSIIDTIDSPFFEEVLKCPIDHCIKISEIGEKIITYTTQENKKTMKRSFELYFENFRFICINNTFTSSSQFNSIWDPNKYDGMLVFFFANNLWNVHLYSTKKDVDLSLIAVKYGGGGHRGACGFQAQNLPFNLPIKNV